MISIECFKGMPIAYEYFLLERYNSFITTCRYIEVYYSTYNINYMLVNEDGKLIEILIFGIRGKTSICLNSLVSLDQNIIVEFTKIIFEQNPGIKKIIIDASYKNYLLNKSILFFKSDDQVLNLASSIDDYYLQLGSKTRKHIKSRNAKLLAEFSKVNFVVKYGDEIDEHIINIIIQFNHYRMRNKGKTSGIDDNYKSNIYKYSQYYGCVVYLELDGVIVAGCISTIINKEIYLHVIAHDNKFSKYNVGEICAFYLIQTSIENKMSKFHFLWGESEMKRRFLAKSHLLFSYSIYRSHSLDFFYNKVKVKVVNCFGSIKYSKTLSPIIKALIKYKKNLNKYLKSVSSK